MEKSTPNESGSAAEGSSPKSRGGFFEGLTPNVYRLSWVSLFADISSEMLYPIIPIFLTSVLGAPVAALGLIEGMAEATASLLKGVAGAFSDRSGRRKPYVFSGYVLSALARPLIALASAWGLVLVARCLDRLGKALRTGPRDALLADSIEEKYRGKAFGFHRGMDTLGAVIGPLLALGLIAALKDDLRLVFVIALVPGLIGAAFVLLVREKATAPRANASAKLVWWPQDLSPQFRRYLIGWGIFSLANSSDMFLLLRVHEAGFSTTGTVFLYVFYNIVYALASPWLGQLSDRVGRKVVLVSGLLIFALVYLGFSFATQVWEFWALYGIYGLYIAATDGVGKALAIDLVPKERRASAIGFLGTVTGLAVLASSTIAGALWSSVGSWAAFAYGAVGAVAAAAVIGLGIRERGEPAGAHAG